MSAKMFCSSDSMKPWSLSLLMCLAAAAVHAQPSQWKASDGGNDHFYEALHAPNGITWAAAQADAVNRGGYLATMTSAAENTFAYGLISSDISYWYVTGSE